MYIFVYIFVYMCIYVFVDICVYIFEYICVHVYIWLVYPVCSHMAPICTVALLGSLALAEETQTPAIIIIVTINHPQNIIIHVINHHHLLFEIRSLPLCTSGQNDVERLRYFLREKIDKL